MTEDVSYRSILVMIFLDGTVLSVVCGYQLAASIFRVEKWLKKYAADSSKTLAPSNQTTWF